MTPGSSFSTSSFRQLVFPVTLWVPTYSDVPNVSFPLRDSSTKGCEHLGNMQQNLRPKPFSYNSSWQESHVMSSSVFKCQNKFTTCGSYVRIHYGHIIKI